MKMKKTKGLSICYTGNGKGKTTAALGLALRAVGRKQKVFIMQFLKNGEYGEHNSLKKISGITMRVCGKGFCKVCGDERPFSEHKKSAQQALREATRALRSKKYDMVVLDEINIAMQCRLITTKDVLKLIAKKPSYVHLVLTGRGAPKSIIKKCDLVSDVREVKHPYQKGVLAQKGIEF